MPPNHQTIRLSAGRHTSPDDGACVMELASMLAGEPFSDHPSCVSDTLAAGLRGYNDGLDGTRRQELKRFAALAVGTAGPGQAEKARRRIIAATLLEIHAERSWAARLGRRFDAADPYKCIRELGRRVVAQDGDVLHQRVLTMFDDIAAVGRVPDAVQCAPEAAACSHPCEGAGARRTLGS